MLRYIIAGVIAGFSQLANAQEWVEITRVENTRFYILRDSLAIIPSTDNSNYYSVVGKNKTVDKKPEVLKWVISVQDCARGRGIFYVLTLSNTTLTTVEVDFSSSNITNIASALAKTICLTATAVTDKSKNTI
jgi:hypothetical protein